MAVFRFTLAIALSCALMACAEQQPPASVAPPAQPTAPAPVIQAHPAPGATAPQSVPSATAAPTHAPTVTPQAAAPARTATAIPAATATVAQAPTVVPGVGQAAEWLNVFPVRSDGKISYGRYHHDYPAADIFCPAGSEFVAVTDGVVDFVSREDIWDPHVNDGATRGGLSVAIVGDDGVRYYGSHLSQIADGIAPGAWVQAGQLLGLTGHSGDARGLDPHLHFGISHPTTPDDWQVRRGEIAPYEYLRAWQRGENITPDLTR